MPLIEDRSRDRPQMRSYSPATPPHPAPPLPDICLLLPRSNCLTPSPNNFPKQSLTYLTSFRLFSTIQNPCLLQYSSLTLSLSLSLIVTYTTMNISTMVPISSSIIAEEEGMDWYAWLSRAGMEPTLAYEYALLFAHNELDQDDIPHLDHDFLLSMGVSVGKHRLQILQLAQKEHRRHPPRPVSRLLAAAGHARRSLARCLRSLAAGDGVRSRSRSTEALMAAQRELFGGGQQWRSAMLKRERKLALLKQGRLMLTDGGVRVTPGSPPVLSPSPRSRSVSPVVFSPRGASSMDGVGDGKLWGATAGEEDREMRWDFMFQDLKPT